MQTTFEKLSGTYRQEGDYLLPNIEAPESPQIGIWGQRRLQYLRTNKRVFNLCCRLCSAYEHKAFIDGLQYGAHLLMVLQQSFSVKRGVLHDFSYTISAKTTCVLLLCSV